MRIESLILYLVPGTAALAAFLFWRWLVGPSLHWVESMAGAAIAVATYLGLFLFFRARLRR